MVQRTRINKSENSKPPYMAYEKTYIGKLIASAINDLVENQDIKEMTLRKYIVGYIAKKYLNLKHI